MSGGHRTEQAAQPASEDRPAPRADKSEQAAQQPLASDVGIGSVVFDQSGLVPAVVQDAATGEVLMIATMNRESLARTLETRETVFWSRSRQELWHKGETSGNTQAVQSLTVDCDGDALLVQVNARGPACHKGTRSCFPRAPAPPAAELARLERTIASRKASAPAESYTAKLLADTELRHQKVTEEAGELVVASLLGKKEAVVQEAADVLYHLLVLLASHDLTLSTVADELERRASGRPADPRAREFPAVELVPLATAEAETFLDRSRASYAEEMAKAEGLPLADALEQAGAHQRALLPQGVATAGHFFLAVRAGGVAAGDVWFCLRTSGATTQAYLCDIVIDGDHRGRGLGNAALAAVAAKARSHGARSLRLHVFSHNTAARRLYLRAGFQATSLFMSRAL